MAKQGLVNKDWKNGGGYHDKHMVRRISRTGISQWKTENQWPKRW